MRRFWIAFFLSLFWADLGSFAWGLEWVVRDHPFTLPSGVELRGKVLGPRNLVQGEKLPLIFLFGGFEEAGKVLDLIRPSRRAFVASFDYPYQAPRRFRFPETILNIPHAKKGAHQTLQGIPVFLDSLLKDGYVDPSKVTLIGASFGAPFAILTFSGSSQFQGLVIVHGFGKVDRTIQHRLTQIWQRKMGTWARPAAWITSKLIWMYLNVEAPEKAAQRFSGQQKVLMIVARDDTFLPKEAVETLWDSIKASQAERKRIDMPGDHLQPGSDHLIQKILDLVDGWMAKMKLVKE